MKARIRDGAIVGQDMGFHEWTDKGEWFEVEDFLPDRKKLVAPGYGIVGDRDGKSYGNGALYVRVADIDYQPEPYLSIGCL